MIVKTLKKENIEIQKQQHEPNNESFPLLEDKGVCHYHNYVTVEKTTADAFNDDQIKVNNRLCKENGDYLQKVTIVKFKDQVITIKDRYYFTTPEPATPQNNLQKRVHIFKKPLRSEQKSEGRKRATKNLPKNFIKAFINYLQQVKDEQNAELLECKIRLFSSKQKYNNSFIQRIVDDSDLQPYFIEFLNGYAKDWIQNSKIRDKDVHFEAIEIFKKLTLDRTHKNTIGLMQLEQFSEYFSDDSNKVSFCSEDNDESDRESILANSSKDEFGQDQN